MILNAWKKKLNYKLIEWQKKKMLPVVIGYPYWMTVDASSMCNLRCVFCPIGQRRNTRPNTVLSYGKFKKIIDKLGQYLLHIDFSNWGEPLLNKDIYRMISYAKKYDLTTKIDTSFNVDFSESDADNMIASGLDSIIISADGASQDAYEIYRRGGNFEKVVENMKLLVTLKRRLRTENPFIHWQFLVFKHNEHEIEKAKTMAKDIGVDSIGFTAPFCSTDWASTKDEFNRYLVKDDKVVFKQATPVCNWLWDGITINADGSVSPCCSVEDKKDDFDDFFAKPFWRLWNSIKYRTARKYIKSRLKPKENNVCTTCNHIGVSNHVEVVPR
jgi:MoaA/NifB/PqqE/SkfB family radical SAM enzyme